MRLIHAKMFLDKPPSSFISEVHQQGCQDCPLDPQLFKGPNWPEPSHLIPTYVYMIDSMCLCLSLPIYPSGLSQRRECCRLLSRMPSVACFDLHRAFGWPAYWGWNVGVCLAEILKTSIRGSASFPCHSICSSHVTHQPPDMSVRAGRECRASDLTPTSFKITYASGSLPLCFAGMSLYDFA